MVEDQAARLRALARREGASPPPRLRAIAVTGGKGGVGKTSIAVNLAILLAKQGLKPLLVDCDLGLANADVLLGLNPQSSLFDVLIGGSPIGSAIIEDPRGLGFLPAASGREELTRLGAAELDRFFSELGRAALGYDLLILDTAAGIHREVLRCCMASSIVLTVVTPDPTSITDAYALIKLLEQHGPGQDLRILVNQAGSQDEAVAVANRLRQVARSYLKRDLGYAGQIPRDLAVRDAVRRRQPAVLGGDSPAVSALRALAQRLGGEFR